MQGEDYVVTAAAKGVGPWRVLVRHALPNSLFGLLTVVGVNIGTLIGVTVIIESIFALPGIGQALVEAIDNRDILVVQGIVLALAVVVVLANLITDLLYAVLDPRIRYGRTAAEADARVPALAPATGRGRVRRAAARLAALAGRRSPRRDARLSCCSSSSSGRSSAPVGKPTGGNILDANMQPFSSGHAFGTDPVGNDIWSRILYGGRSSIEIALAVQLIGLIIGGAVGAVRGATGAASWTRS